MKGIILAGSNTELCAKIKAFLSSNGFPVFETSPTAAGALKAVAYLDGGVVICVRLTDMPPQALADLLEQSFTVLALVPSGQPVTEIPSGKLVFLRMPLERRDLLDEVRQLMAASSARFGSASSSSKKLSDAETEIVARAKKMLMNSMIISESRAYAYLRRRSMDEGRKIADIAKEIIEKG